MTRRLLNLLTALSLLLCVAAPAMWLRSYRVRENVIWSVRARSADWRYWEMTDAGLATRPGMLLLGRVSEWAGSAAETPPTWRRARARYNGGGTMVGAEVTPSRLGFGWASGASPPSAAPRRPGRRFWLVSLPWWSLLLAASAPPLYRLLPTLGRLTRRARRFIRTPPVTGLCDKCGYDLRATPGRCPECGTADVRLAGGGRVGPPPASKAP
jgi:hypothetical protein